MWAKRYFFLRRATKAAMPKLSYISEGKRRCRSVPTAHTARKERIATLTNKLTNKKYERVYHRPPRRLPFTSSPILTKSFFRLGTKKSRFSVEPGFMYVSRSHPRRKSVSESADYSAVSSSYSGASTSGAASTGASTGASSLTPSATTITGTFTSTSLWK